MHAAYCEELATQLDSAARPTRSANGYQATAAAVDAVHCAVGIAGVQMAQRVRSAAGAVAATADAFDAEERTAAAALRSPAAG